MPRLKVEPAASVFDPVEVEIGGQVFTLRPVDRAMVRTVQELDARVAKGDLDAPYDRLEVLLGPSEALAGLVLSQVNQITDFLINSILRPMAAEKNGPKPGAGQLPS